MSPLFRRALRAQQANADQARRIRRRPVYDWQRLTAAELGRLHVLLDNARRLSKGKRIDWRKVSDDDLMEIHDYYQKARVTRAD
jgi:hypothetical protein